MSISPPPPAPPRNAGGDRPLARRAVPALGLVFALVFTLAVAGCGSETGRGPEGVGGGTAVAPTTTIDPRYEPLPPGATTVLVVGDSVILGAEVQVPAALAGWKVTFDAKESRRIQAGIALLKARKGPTPRVVVIHLCTNWAEAGYAKQIDDTMAELEGVDRVVWVTCEPWRLEVAAANADIKAAADRYPNLVVADWAALAERPGYSYSDHLHLKTPGAVALAALVAEKVGPAPRP